MTIFARKSSFIFSLFSKCLPLLNKKHQGYCVTWTIPQCTGSLFALSRCCAERLVHGVCLQKQLRFVPARFPIIPLHEAHFSEQGGSFGFDLEFLGAGPRRLIGAAHQGARYDTRHLFCQRVPCGEHQTLQMIVSNSIYMGLTVGFLVPGGSDNLEAVVF